MMDEIHALIQKRNSVETLPYLEVHASNAALQNLVDTLQSKCDALQRDISVENNSSSSATTTTAALKNEARLRDKLEKLQEELAEKLRHHAEDSARALQTSKDLANMKDLNEGQAKIISTLKGENENLEKQISVIANELKESQSRTDLAEQQYMGLKETIRTLQEENDSLKKENYKLVERVVTEKDKVMEEVAVLNKMVEKQKSEIDMLRNLNKQEAKRKTWFGKVVGSEAAATKPKKEEAKTSSGRKWGTMGVMVPTEPLHIIQSHSAEATCVRYDGTGHDLVATSGNDSTVKVWDTGNGTLRATLRGGSGHTLASCDIGGGLVAGGGSDKTCRVWNLKTERMIHHLVGHGNKITCVRLLNGEKAVLTGSADHSMKLWDISRGTYRQTTTLRFGSISNCIDVGPDNCTVVSGHHDGSLRFWDIRTGDRTADLPGIHAGSITSVQFHPTVSTLLLTNGKDSKLKVVDVRTCKVVNTLQHRDFRTSFGHSSSSFSPDGMYAASGSSSSGDIFVWRVADESLQKRIKGHTAGVGGFAWSRGGTNGQQVASVDRNGTLIMWA